MRDVRLSEAGRQEILDLPADQLSVRISEQALEPGVHLADRAVGRRDEEGGPRRVPDGMPQVGILGYRAHARLLLLRLLDAVQRHHLGAVVLDDEDALKPLQYLADFGHELLLVQLWTPFDRDPGYEGEVSLVDAETNAQLEFALDEPARQRYLEAFDRYSGALEDLAIRSGGRYAGFPTSVPLEEAIFNALDWAGAAMAARRGA